MFCANFLNNKVVPKNAANASGVFVQPFKNTTKIKITEQSGV